MNKIIEFGIKKIQPYGDKREINAFIIEVPHSELNIIKIFSDLEDINYFIEWLQDDVINQNIPDYSFENGIEFQPILFGSLKSKIAKIKDGEFVAGQEFDTKDFLEVCCAWRDFLQNEVKK